MFGLSPVKEVVVGQFLLSLGALFYTFWWLTAFRPDARSGGALSALLFLLLAIFGLSGVGFSAHGVHELPLPSSWIGTGMIFIAAAAAYFLLLAGSLKLFGRKPTTELLLIVCWAVLEILVLGVLHEGGLLLHGSYGAAWVFVAAASVLAFAAYMVYYRMDDHTAYVTGAIPLLVDGAVTLYIGCVAVMAGK